MAQFSFKLFGAFQVSLNGQPVTKFPTDKIRALLVYLLLHADQPLRRDTLTGLFWAEQTEQAARHNLRQSLYRLRRTFDAVEPRVSDRLLTMTRQTVTLHAAEVESDVQQAEALLKRDKDNDPAALAQAVALYTGEFMAGFSLPDAVAFDEWLRLQREGWLQQTLQMLHTLIQQHQQRGELAQVVTYASRQIELEPLRESAYRHLMLAFAQQGQRNKALAYYEVCRQLLEGDLGVEPAAETTDLYEKIKAETFRAQPTVSAAADIPRLATPLIGREVDITAVIHHLQQPTCRLVTLLGEGGIGKTSLATAVVHQVELDTRFPDGRYFIQLAGLTKSDYLVAAIGRGMGLVFTGKVLDKEQLWDFCRHKSALLILDNFEHLMDGVSLLAELTAVAPQLTLLITSRESLNLKVEQRHLLTGLPYPTDLHEETNMTFSAVDLFVNAAQRVKPAFELTAQNQTAVYEICQLVQGSPLALEFAAAWVRLMDCDQIAIEIKQSLAFLTSSRRDEPERHQSMLAVFEQSWQLLTTQEQRNLTQLAHFHGWFTLEAALTITQISLLDLAGLVDKSLVQRNEKGRYALHELLRQYLVQKIAPNAQVTLDLIRQHSDFYLTCITNQSKNLLGEQSPAAVIELKQALDNIRLAWQMAVQNQWWEMLQMSIEGMSNYYFLTGYLPELASLLTETLRLSQTAVPASLMGIILEKLTIIYTRQGRYDEAKRSAKQLTNLGRQAQNRDFEMRAGICLAQLQQHQGEYGKALAAFETAVTFYTETENLARLAQLNNLIGNLLHLQGKFDVALTHHQDGLEISCALGNAIQQAKILGDIGNAYTAQGDIDQALSIYQQALEISQKLNQHEGIARILHNMGRIYLRQNKEAEALSHFQESLALNKQLGFRRGIALTLNTIGIIYKRQQKYIAALEYYEQALAINRELGIKNEIANNLSNIGNIYRREGQLETAEPYLQEALQLAEEADYPEGIVGHLGNLALLYIERESWARAQAAYGRAIALARQINENFFLAYLLVRKAELCHRLNQPTEARHLAAEGVQIAKEIGNQEIIADGLSLLKR